MLPMKTIIKSRKLPLTILTPPIFRSIIQTISLKCLICKMISDQIQEAQLLPIHGEEITDANSIKSLVRTIYENITFLISLLPPLSVCLNHGYMAGRVDQCKKCGANGSIFQNRRLHPPDSAVESGQTG